MPRTSGLRWIDSPAQKAFYRQMGNLIRETRRGATGRRAPKLTQAQLGRAIGLSAPVMVNIESGRQRVGAHVLARIADVLRVPVSALVPSYPVDEQTPT